MDLSLPLLFPSNNDYHQNSVKIMVDLMKQYLPMDGYWMKALFTVGALLPCVGIAILLKQIVTEATDFIPFFVGFTLDKISRIELGIQLPLFH